MTTNKLTYVTTSALTGAVSTRSSSTMAYTHAVLDDDGVAVSWHKTDTAAHREYTRRVNRGLRGAAVATVDIHPYMSPGAKRARADERARLDAERAVPPVTVTAPSSPVQGTETTASASLHETRTLLSSPVAQFDAENDAVARRATATTCDECGEFAPAGTGYAHARSCSEYPPVQGTETTAPVPSAEFLNDVLITACEGGVNYWADVTDYRARDAAHDYGHGHGVTTATLTVRSDVVDDGDEPESHAVTVDTVAAGIAHVRGRASLSAGWRPLLDAIDEGDAGALDANDADALVQYGIFGSLVYG